MNKGSIEEGVDKIKGTFTPEEFNDYVKSQFLTCNDISTEARKDVTEKLLDLSKELRSWVIQVTIISTAIIGAIVALGKVNQLNITALFLLFVSIAIGLFHIKNILENQIIYLNKWHVSFQTEVENLKRACLDFFNNKDRYKYLEIQEEVFKKMRAEDIIVRKDSVITFVFILFIISLIVLIVSFFNYNYVSTWLKDHQQLGFGLVAGIIAISLIVLFRRKSKKKS